MGLITWTSASEKVGQLIGRPYSARKLVFVESVDKEKSSKSFLRANPPYVVLLPYFVAFVATPFRVEAAGVIPQKARVQHKDDPRLVS